MTTKTAQCHFDGHGIYDAEGQRIAKVSGDPYVHTWDGPKRNEEYDRLSNLIAAAPEMLEALEHIDRRLEVPADGKGLAYLPFPMETVAILRAAIQKARGENQ